MKRKISLIALALICAVFCAFGLAACGAKKPNDSDTPPGTQTETPSTPTPTVTYTVTFDANGGAFSKGDVNLGDDITIDDGTVVSSDGTKLTLTVTNASLFSEPLKFPERSGTYAFVGWAKDKDGAELWDFDKDALNSDLTLYAAWAITFDFKLSDDGTYYTVRGIGGLSGDVEIPETHNRKPVKEILPNAFMNSRTLTGIIIPDSVTAIGTNAFKNAINLEKVTVGEGVTKLPDSVFADSDRLIELGLPRSLTEIEYNAFGNDGTRSILEVRYAGTIDEWCAIDMDCSTSTKANPLSNGKATLYIGGEPATDVTINAEKINQYAFYNCKTLKKVTIGAQVKDIGAEAFYFNEITTLDFASNAALTTIGTEAFANCSKIKQIVLPENLVTVGTAAFKNCYECAKIDLGGTKYVYSEAFESAYALIDLNLRRVEEIGESAFFCGIDEGALTSVTIPDSVWYLGGGCFTSKSITNITVDGNENTTWNASWIENNKQQSGSFTNQQLNASGRERLMSATMQRVYGTLNYSYNDGYRVTGVTNSGVGVLIIPEVYNDKHVVAIERGAFDNCNGLKAISIPRYMVSIDTNLASCESLRTISVNVNNTAYGSNGTVLFAKSKGTIVWTSPTLLTSKEIIIPEGVKVIDDDLFEGYQNLQFLTFPDSLTTVGNRAFASSGLSSGVILPDNVTSIGNFAFADCKDMLSIYIPNSVSSIGKGAFDGCTSLTGIFIDDDNTNFCSKNGIFFDKKTNDLIWIAPSAVVDGEIKLPNDIVLSGNEANGYTVTIEGLEYQLKGDSATITQVTNSQATEFSILEKISFNGKSYPVTSIADHVFYNNANLRSVTFPNSLTAIGEEAFVNSNITQITIPGSVKTIGGRAFAYCSNLVIYCEASGEQENWDSDWNYDGCPVIWNCKNNYIDEAGYAYATFDNIQYKLKDGIAKIRWQSVSGNIVIPASVHYKNKVYSVTEIPSGAFEGCKGLTSIVIPNSVTSIDAYAFYGCTGLTSVTIGNNVASIGNDAFCDCTGLTSITYTSDIKGWCAISGLIEIMSYGKAGKTLTINGKEIKGELVIPNDVTSIGDDAFYGCTALTSVVIPNSVTYIGNYAFYECKGLTIYCEAESKPDGWNSSWTDSSCTVVWGYKV